MASAEVREALRKPFPTEKVQQRQGPGGKKLDYVAGETIIERLLEDSGGYAWQAQIVLAERGLANVNPDEDTAPIMERSGPWTVLVQGTLLIDGDAGTGVGAMTNPDLDMACKSANTEALKNAAKNGFGVGLELWDKDYRDQLGQKRKALAGNEQAKKALVMEIARQRLGPKPDLFEIADLFGVAAGDLSDPATMDAILKDEGLL